MNTGSDASADREFLDVLDGKYTPEEMPRINNAPDCVLKVSENEGPPNIVREAPACNVSIVSVPVGGVPERLKGFSRGSLWQSAQPQLGHTNQ